MGFIKRDFLVPVHCGLCGRSDTNYGRSHLPLKLAPKTIKNIVRSRLCFFCGLRAIDWKRRKDLNKQAKIQQEQWYPKNKTELSVLDLIDFVSYSMKHRKSFTHNVYAPSRYKYVDAQKQPAWLEQINLDHKPSTRRRAVGQHVIDARDKMRVRHNLILNVLTLNGEQGISVSCLAQEFECANSTIYSDLDYLKTKGLVERIGGGPKTRWRLKTSARAASPGHPGAGVKGCDGGDEVSG